MGKGIKYDDGKPRLAEMIKDFAIPLTEVCSVWEFGANKCGKSNWKMVEDGERRYTNALLRHLVQEEYSEFDEESKLRHATHVAWNALARLWFILNEKVLEHRDHDIILTPEGDIIKEDNPHWIGYIKDFYENNRRYMDKKIEPLD